MLNQLKPGLVELSLSEMSELVKHGALVKICPLPCANQQVLAGWPFLLHNTARLLDFWSCYSGVDSG
jgi:hypothetical protein